MDLPVTSTVSQCHYGNKSILGTFPGSLTYDTTVSQFDYFYMLQAQKSRFVISVVLFCLVNSLLEFFCCCSLKFGAEHLACR